MKQITLYDVAQHAGVSYQTVSRVVNQASHVSAHTREKVEAAMAELNYIPNRIAQQLAGKQRPLIGVATTHLGLHAPSQIVAAIKSRADQCGASVVIAMIEKSGVDACKTAIINLLAQRVTGLIINFPLEEQAAKEVASSCGNVPALFLDVSMDSAVPSVIFSPQQGTLLGVSHLLAWGHRRIALLNGPQESVSARLRRDGWYHALAEQGLQPVAEITGDWSALSGYQQTRQLLEDQGILPQALLIANDQMALGALRAISEAGLRVPDDISLIGYDDTEDSCCYIPPLTTIKQDFRQLGEMSVDRLLALDSEQHIPLCQQLPVSLVPRQTVGYPASSEPSPRSLAISLQQLAQQVARLSTPPTDH
ncbi:LacI family DNA-binding transcriptional regulator [Tatumella saanichensis]|uniref:LacI family DNA-binding transcriptional regulator n=1 Tax=Tatumella saanichensis TaxID=480813 RepID=UPI0004A2B555|nr:LacI family DNA-binding transcriptional regulator [Tatumella saanichensis]